MDDEKTPTTSDEEKDVEGHGPYSPVAEPVTERDAAPDEKDDVEGHGPYSPVTEPVTERDAALDEKDDVEGHIGSPVAKPVARPTND